jgi:uncharacterized protein (DUF362 family)
VAVLKTHSIILGNMIAEINTAYTPDLVIVDAVDAFINGGPDSGTLAHPGLVLAGTDRVTIDAVQELMNQPLK